MLGPYTYYVYCMCTFPSMMYPVWWCETDVTYVVLHFAGCYGVSSEHVTDIAWTSSECRSKCEGSGFMFTLDAIETKECLCSNNDQAFESVGENGCSRGNSKKVHGTLYLKGNTFVSIELLCMPHLAISQHHRVCVI